MVTIFETDYGIETQVVMFFKMIFLFHLANYVSDIPAYMLMATHYSLSIQDEASFKKEFNYQQSILAGIGLNGTHLTLR